MTRSHRQTAKRTKIGYDYIHSLVDGHSRFAYSEILPDEKGATCAAFLLRAADAFAAVGVTTIEEPITDKHLSYKRSNDVRDAVTALDAALIHQASLPWQNGKHRALQPHLRRRVGLPAAFTRNAQRAAALAPLSRYNTGRRHSAWIKPNANVLLTHRSAFR